jgi:hypothetical protein
MYGPPVTLRCTRCGTYFAAPAPPTTLPAWVPCPHCKQPAAVLAPRDPAPLFTWEAFPHLYPSVALPRLPGRRAPQVALILLAALATLLCVVAGGLLYQGASALPNHPYTVSGQVFALRSNGSGPVPEPGAVVNLTGEDGFRATDLTNAEGQFSFAKVPSGGIAINVTAPHFAPITVVIFATPVYSSPSGRPTNLTIDIVPGPIGAGTTVQESPFADLEQFVATLWSGTSVLAIAAIIAVLGIVRLVRNHRYIWGIAGGVAGAVAPVALFELGTFGLFPILDGVVAVLAVLGVAAAILLTILLTSDEPTVPAE